MEKFFKLKENGTTVSTEIMAGITTFFAMAYIIAVNPSLLSSAGMEWGAVFLATIISSVIGTLIMGLVANVPYAQAPGMGLNAFFVYTVCFALEFTWQQALSMVFICGLINIFITVTKIRKIIIKAIPTSLQNAIGGGIGVFIAYLGFLNAGLITFDSGVPAMANINTPSLWVFLIGLFSGCRSDTEESEGRYPDCHRCDYDRRNPLRRDNHDGHGQLHGCACRAAVHLWRDLHIRGTSVLVHGSLPSAAGADHDLCLQHVRYL